MSQTESAACSNAPRDFFVTGVPRSGSSLLCAVLDRFPDVVCLNEVYWDTENLPDFFESMRDTIRAQQPVADRVDEDGLPVTDVTRYPVGARTIVKPLSDRFLLGHKGGSHWLVQLPRVLKYGLPTLAIIRDPVLTIASWSQPHLEETPVARMTRREKVSDGWRTWNGLTLSFHSDPERSPIERRAMLWNCLAFTLLDVRGKVKIVRYEDLVTDPEGICRELSGWLGTDAPTARPAIDTLDWSSRYGEALIEECRAAVVRFAPLRCAWGYP